MDKQGNFGAIDGSPAAAQRYTEARMSEAAVDLLDDLEKDTVDLVAQLRRFARRTDGPARALPEPLVQRLAGHRRRHGDLRSAAQPA
jgi:DNA gyrase subunit A